MAMSVRSGLPLLVLTAALLVPLLLVTGASGGVLAGASAAKLCIGPPDAPGTPPSPLLSASINSRPDW